MMEVKDHVLVKRGLYYRPNGNGYTGLKREAGLYAASYACDMEGVTAVPFAEADQFAPACREETKLAELRAELAALKAREVGYVQAMDAMGEELAARDAALREALALMRGEPDMSLPGSDHWLWAKKVRELIGEGETA